jgi:hypothetical protein
MKLSIAFSGIINIYTFNTIGLVFPERAAYMSSQIEPIHRPYLERALAKMSIPITLLKNDNHIRIQYCESVNSCYGNTAMSGSVYPSGAFVVETTVVSFNRDLEGNTLECVLLHELSHAQGLRHNVILGSIMNYTLYTFNGKVINDADECELNYDDVDGLENLQKNMISYSPQVIRFRPL